MIFSELYSVYYHTVARILETALDPKATEKDLQRCVMEDAFSESSLTILPALKTGKWPLLHEDLTSVLRHAPTMPLTLLEKRWLKAIEGDPRMKLFGVKFPDLGDVEPLFAQEDIKIYDKYDDGDPYDDETYIKHFRLIRSAIKFGLPIQISMVNRNGKNVRFRFYPKGFEYSAKDDKIRVIADKCKFRRFNLARIVSLEFYHGHGAWKEKPPTEQRRELTLQITDERNALERAMLHFAHFEKRTERADDGKYILRLKYYEDDETEMVIRVLAFGPLVKVLEPQSFVNLVRDRLIAQRKCGVR